MTFMSGPTESDMPAEQQCQFAGDTNVKINSIVVMVYQGQTCILSNSFNQLDCHEEMEQASGKNFLQDEPAGLPEKEKDSASEDELLPEASVEVNNIKVNINQFMVHDWQEGADSQDDYSASKNFLEGKPAVEPGLPGKERDLASKCELLPEASVEVKLINANVNQSMVNNWQEGADSQDDYSASKNFLEGKPAIEPGLPEKEKDLASQCELLPEANVEVKLINANVNQYPARDWQEGSSRDSGRRELQEEDAGELSVPGKEKSVNLERKKRQASIEINHICMNVSQYPGRLYQEIFAPSIHRKKETCKQLGPDVMLGILPQEGGLPSPEELVDSAILEQANTGDDLIVEAGDSKITQPVLRQVPGNDDNTNTGGEESNSVRLISLPEEGINEEEANEEVTNEEVTNEKVTNEKVANEEAVEINIIEGAESLEAGSRDHPYLKENVLKHEEIIDRKITNVASETEKDSIDDADEAGENENLTPEPEKIFEGGFGRPQQRLQTIILAFGFIIGLFFFRAKNNVK